MPLDYESSDHGHAGQHDRDVVLSMMKRIPNRVRPIHHIHRVELVLKLLGEPGDSDPRSAQHHQRDDENRHPRTERDVLYPPQQDVRDRQDQEIREDVGSQQPDVENGGRPHSQALEVAEDSRRRLMVRSGGTHKYHGEPGTNTGACDEHEHNVYSATDRGDEFADFEEEEEDRDFDEGKNRRVDDVEC